MLTRFRHFRFGAILGPLIPFFATFLALLVGAVMLLALGANPLDAYGALVKGAFGSPNALADTVVKAPPLLFVGLGICIALNVNEILSTIMMNMIAVQGMNFLLRGPMMDPVQIKEGQIMGIVKRGEATVEELGLMMAGVRAQRRGPVL